MENLAQSKRRKTIWGCSGLLILILAILLLPCISCYGGLVFSDAIHPEIPEWRHLGKPPSEINRLMAADFSTIYVETVDKKIYSCYWASPLDINCWKEIEKVPEILFSGRCIPGEAPNAPLPPEENIKDKILFEYCGSFAGNTNYSIFAYYLLEDGTVTQWGRDEFHLFNLPSYVCIALTAALIFGMTAYLVIVVSISIFTYRAIKSYR